MRKTTTTATIILLICFGSLLLAANVMLSPFKKDADFARKLQAELLSQELLAPDTKLVVRTLPGGNEKRLAEDTALGVVIWYEPHVSTLARADGLRALSIRILDALAENPPRGKLPPWVELNVEQADEVILRSLVPLSQGGFAEPEPPLPEIWVPGVGGQDAPRRRGRAGRRAEGGSEDNPRRDPPGGAAGSGD